MILPVINHKASYRVPFLLGADAAAVGRSMMPYLEKAGASGVESYLTKVQNELRYIMSNTGFAKVSDIDDSALWFN